MQTGYIYALIDPRDNVVRYIGQTIGTLEDRCRQHIAAPTNPKMHAWLAELKGAGLRPIIQVLEVTELVLLNEREYHWIASLLERGDPLLNARGPGIPPPRGRPKSETPTALHKRTMAFPPDLYVRLMEIAAHEERDVTSQIIKVLRDFVARYDREAEEGQLAAQQLAA